MPSFEVSRRIELFPATIFFSFSLKNNASNVGKDKRKYKNKMLLRHVTTSLFLRNYLPPPERYAKRLQQIFFQDTMEPRNLCLFNCVLH
jgi:hypothetical protein